MAKLEMNDETGGNSPKKTKKSGDSGNGGTKRPSLKETFGIDRSSMSPMKIGVLIFSMALIGIGAFLHFSGGGSQVADAGTPSGAPAHGFSGQNNFSGDNLSNIFDSTLTNLFPESSQPQTKSADQVPENMNEWSPTFLRGGAGLFLGFCVGFAIRSFVKLGSVILGFYILSLLMLSWLGWIEINYPEIDAQLGNLTESLKTQFESFKAFLAGSIPTAGLAGVGFFSGLKKK